MKADQSPSGPVMFYGDPHGRWEALIAAALDVRPDTVVLVGDADLDEPLRAKLAPLFDAGVHIRWIFGNHDSTDHRRWDFLTLGHVEGGFGVSAFTVAGLTIAGLGGVFRGHVWFPRLGTEAPLHRTRLDFLREAVPTSGRWRGGLPLRHRTTIFPEDYTSLTSTVGKADILVTHEAPTSHDMGFGAIDDLARDLGARLVIHGHLHTTYEGRTRHGIPVRGLGRAEPWVLEERILASASGTARHPWRPLR